MQTQDELRKIGNSLETQFLKEKIIVPGDWTNVKGMSTKIPIGIYLQDLIENHYLFMETVRNMIHENNHDDGCFKEATRFAGFGNDGIPLAMKIAEMVEKKYVALRTDPVTLRIAGYREEKHLQNEKVVIVAGILATGNNCAQAIQLVESAGAKVVGIAVVFDYGFWFKSHLRNFLKKDNCKDVQLSSVTTMKDIAEKIEFDNNPLIEWIVRNPHALWKKVEQTA